MRTVGLCLTLLLLAAVGPAQTAATSAQTTTYGSTNPEQIPDATAYLMIFSAHSHFNDTAAQTTTETLHRQVGFSQADHAVYDIAMNSFRTAYDALVASEKAALAAAPNHTVQTAIQQQLVQGLGVLVTNTLATLQSQLSPTGQQQLSAFVQGEKAHIIISKGAK